jgi:hypothetical protein
MQILSAPTRKDIDRAHARKRWLGFGGSKHSKSQGGFDSKSGQMVVAVPELSLLTSNVQFGFLLDNCDLRI